MTSLQNVPDHDLAKYLYITIIKSLKSFCLINFLSFSCNKIEALSDIIKFVIFQLIVVLNLLLLTFKDKKNKISKKFRLYFKN